MGTLTLLAALLPFLAGCGKSVSGSDVESGTKEQLEKQGLSAEKVDCPGDLKAEVGEKMTCEATVAEDTIEVKLEVTEVKDGTAVWTVKPEAGQ